MNILIVEDKYDNYFLLHEFLIHYDHNIFWAEDGVKCIEIYKNNKIDIILLDMRMPNMSGYDVLKIIRETDKEIPIIAQTAYVSLNDENKLLKQGCNEYLSKPIDLDNLISILNKYN